MSSDAGAEARPPYTGDLRAVLSSGAKVVARPAGVKVRGRGAVGLLHSARESVFSRLGAIPSETSKNADSHEETGDLPMENE
jgi:hypothetical protein